MSPTHLSVTSNSTTPPLHIPTYPNPANEWGPGSITERTTTNVHAKPTWVSYSRPERSGPADKKLS